MGKMRDLRDAVVGVMAIGTAFGLGVLTCAYWELKLLASACRESTINIGKDSHTDKEEGA